MALVSSLQCSFIISHSTSKKMKTKSTKNRLQNKTKLNTKKREKLTIIISYTELQWETVSAWRGLVSRNLFFLKDRKMHICHFQDVLTASPSHWMECRCDSESHGTAILKRRPSVKYSPWHCCIPAGLLRLKLVPERENSILFKPQFSWPLL